MRRQGGITCAALALVLAGCVAPDGDIHLEPFFANFATADGARETEAFFGLYHRRVGGVRRRHPEDPPNQSQLTVGPFFSEDRGRDYDLHSRWHFLVPFGYALDREDEGFSMLIPLYIWRYGPKQDGQYESMLLTVFGWIVRNDGEKTEFGWFPFYGNIHSFSIFDQFQFFLWPLWMKTERDGSVSRHVLFPFLGWTKGEGRRGWRVWPLAGHQWHEGYYDRWFVLWPFFHFHRNRLWTSTPETKWMFWPLFGRTRAGEFRAWTFLWPFFGYSHGGEPGFWALDFPWPFIRLQHGPDELRRWRFWPLFSYLRAGSLEAWDFLWPIIRRQKERYPLIERDSFFFFPLWQSFVERDLEKDLESTWRKLFPLFQYETSGDWRRGSFPTLDFFQRNELIDRHFSWLWKLWEWEAEGTRLHTRSIAGIVHHEEDEREERTSFSGLWARRERQQAGGSVREHSLLFGLLRWRVTEGEGFDMLRPAFPGPGWPAEWGAVDEPQGSGER